jgi:shikimate kinase
MLIYLVGYMASGKTYTGPRLAQALGYSFIDLDQEIETRYKISIRDFFSKYGEEQFRKAERIMLENTIHLNNIVVSTGGGTACFYDNMALMNASGITVYLRQSAETLVRRLKHSKKPRPLADNNDEEALRTQIIGHLEMRIAYYERAKIIVDTHTSDIEKIALLVRMYTGHD